MGVFWGVSVGLAGPTGVNVGAKVAEAVGDPVAVAIFVGIAVVFSGTGVLVNVLVGSTSEGVSVRVGKSGTAGVLFRDTRTTVGVGVNKNTPVTTGSPPFACPSSSRIASNTSGFIGATLS